MLKSPDRADTVIPWRDRPHHPMKTAAEIAGVSIASLYRYASEGRLSLRRLAGRTLVETGSLVALIDSAEEWTPSPKTKRAIESRAARAQAAWDA